MIIVMKPAAPQASIQNVVNIIREKGLDTHLSEGKEVTIIGVVGDKSRLQDMNMELMPDVEKIVPITESYKLTNKKFHPDPSAIKVGNAEIGRNTLTIMAGPCAIESEEQLISIAHAVKDAGATFLRGGAYKPRTSPYSFQGLEEEGLLYMKRAKDETGLATICEVISRESLACAVKYVDMIQIGARNMQNFQLLREVGKAGIPVLLKRGMCATIEEWLNAAEYIISEGNPNVVLCERGIRTYETSTRNTLDISAVPVLKSKTHLPVIVDPSHASGVWEYVNPLSKCAVAAGADGLMIEVHDHPECALSDGPQSLTFKHFSELTKELQAYAALSGRHFK